MTKVIEDRRENKQRPAYWVVFQDNFLSGWGLAQNRSLLVLAAASPEEAYTILANGNNRCDMHRGRINSNLPRLRDGDHMAIVDRASASRWYEKGGW